jgi:type II secretory pathway pseudopilin PulG
METSQDLLVIILSTALAVLLVLAIAIAVLVLKLLQSIKRITEKAEHVIETAEHVGEAFSNASGSLALFRIVRNIAEMVSKHSPKTKKDR